MPAGNDGNSKSIKRSKMKFLLAVLAIHLAVDIVSTRQKTRTHKNRGNSSPG